MAGSCSIHRGPDGRISRVETPEGKRSKLFDALASIPVMENRERAASFFKKVFTPKFKRLFGDWEKGVPRNREAYEKIRRKLRGFPENERRAVLQYAAKMTNPVMARRVDSPFNDDNSGRGYYSETEGSGPWYVFDAFGSRSVRMEDVLPEGRDEAEYAPSYISFMPGLTNRVTATNGKEYHVVARSVLVRDTRSIEADPLDGMVYDTGEPRLFFLTEDGRVFDNYGDALNATKGRAVYAGFMPGTAAGSYHGEVIGSEGVRLAAKENFITFMEIPTDSNPLTRNGLINRLIRKGMLDGSKRYDETDGRYKLIGKGNTLAEKLYGSAITYGELLTRLAPKFFEIDERGFITIRDFNPDRLEMRGKDGKKIVGSRLSIRRLLYSGRYPDLDAQYEFADPIVASIALEDASRFERGRRTDKDNLSLEYYHRITSILRSLGVRVIGMSEYIEKYVDKYGAEPTAKALADIANGVIAVAENATTEDLIEEVAHFLVEAYTDQAAIDRALEGIRDTAEWRQYASEYYNVYGRTRSGAELDRAVEREILGKILARELARQSSYSDGQNLETLREMEARGQEYFAEDRGFLARVRELIRQIRDFFASKLGGQRGELNRLVRDMALDAQYEFPSYFNTEQLAGNTYTMYSLGDRMRESFLDNRLNDLKRILSSLRRLRNDAVSDGYDNMVNLEASGMAAAAEVESERLSLLERDIKRVEADIDSTEYLRALGGLVNTADAMARYAETVVEAHMDAVRNIPDDQQKPMFRPSNRAAIDVLTNQVLPMLNAVKARLNKDIRNYKEVEGESKEAAAQRRSDREEARRLGRKIDEAVARINSVRTEADSLFEEDQGTFFKNLFDKWNVSQDNRARIMDMINQVQKDVNIMARWFGLLEHSGNIIDAALGRLICDNYYNAHVQVMDDVRGFLREVQKNGWDVNRFERLIKKNPDGSWSGYLMGELDQAKFDWEFRLKQMDIMAEIYPDSEFAQMSAEERRAFVKKNTRKKFWITKNARGSVTRTINFKPSSTRFDTTFMSLEEENKYNEAMARWKEENYESLYTRQHEMELEAIRKDAEAKQGGRPLDAESLEFIRRVQKQKYYLRNNPKFFETLASGRRVFRADLFAISPEHAQFVRINGLLKEAAQSYYISNGVRHEKTGKDRDRAEDIRNYLEARNEHYAKRKSAGVMRSEILDLVSRIERERGSKAAWDFLAHGGHFSFTDEFYDSVGGYVDENGRSLYERLAEEIKNRRVPDAAYEEALDAEVERILAARDRMRSILQLHRDTNDLGNILVDEFTSEEREEYLTAAADMAAAVDSLRGKAEALDIDVDDYYDTGGVAENAVNNSYYAAVKSSGESEYNFLVSGRAMSRKKAGMLRRFREKLVKGKTTGYSLLEREILIDELSLNCEPKDKSVFEAAMKQYLDAENSSALSETVADRIAVTYGRKMVYGYYKRFAPSGFSEFMDYVQNNEVSVREFVEDLMAGKEGNAFFDNRYIRYTPGQDWLEEEFSDDSIYNPDYNKDSGYGRNQPRRDKYRDEEYYKYFGINEAGEATRNLEDFRMLQMLKELNRKANEAYGLHDRSVYSLPQVSKSSLERMREAARLNPAEPLRNWVRELVTDVVDDSIYGRTDLNTPVDAADRRRVVPKYYVYDLEEGSDVSHDLARSFGMLISQARLYSEKMNSYSTAIGLEQALLRQQFEGGRKAEATNSYGLFKNFLDDHWYGIKIDTQKKMTVNIGGWDIDVTKMINGLERFFSWMNLALSPAVAVTSAITGNATLAIESLTGQYVDADSWRYSGKELLRQTPEYASEIGDLDRKAKVYVIGERLGAFQFRNRLHGAGFSKATRILTRDVTYKMMEVMNSSLHPQMVIAVLDGARYYDHEFYTKDELYAKFKAEGRADKFADTWRSLRGVSLWNSIEVEDGVIKPAKGVEATQEEIEKGLARHRNRLRSFMNVVDGSLNEEQRIAAARHTAMRFLLAHRGWMTIAGERIFSRNHFNFMTNQFEEGMLTSLKQFGKDLYNIGTEDGYSNFANNLKKAWGNMDSSGQYNFIRMGIYTALWGLGFVVAQALLGVAGDDDAKDDWATQFACYVGLRAINEIASMSPGFYTLNLVDVASDPFVNVRHIQDILTPGNWSSEKITSGSYKGESKAWRTIARQTFIKQWYTYKTTENLRRAMDWWRQTNNYSMWFFGAAR